MTTAFGTTLYVLTQKSKNSETWPDEIDTWMLLNPNRVWESAADIIQVCQPTEERRIPLIFLLGSLSIARMYMFQDILEVLIPALENRLFPETFDAISRAAIKADVQTIRAYCLTFARDSSNGIQKMYNEGILSPEVQMELAGMWSPRQPPVKRRKL